MTIATAALLLAASWPQFGRDAAHTGRAAVSALPMQKVLASVVMDPFVAAEMQFFGSDLLVHYASPIIDGDNVYLEIKGGAFTGNWATETFGVQALQWRGSQLVPRWTTMTDWKPVPSTRDGGPTFEPVFQPVLANGFLYMPGTAGSVLRVDPNTGAIVDRLGPPPAPADRIVVVSGPLVVDSAGNIFYNIIELAASNSPWTVDIKNAHLARIAPDRSFTSVSYGAIVKGAPAGTAACLGTFNEADLPWPPSPSALPATVPCGSQRPGVNVAPAVASDGTIYTISRAHLNSRYGYLVAVNADLTPKWRQSLRDRFADGCNVLLPPNGTPGGCRANALTGVDPADNTLGAGRVLDDSTSSPLVAPDGSILYGAYTRYNYTQGHLMHFSAAGAYLGAYPFGWDITPGIYAHGNTYSIVTKENHYDVGSYCDTCASGRPAGFFVTSLTPALKAEWSTPTTTGYEWCVNGPAIDSNGVAYVNSEDGSLYAINPDGTERASVHMTDAMGQAYTPVVIDDFGRLYAEKAGTVFVIGAPLRQRAVRK